MRGVGAVGAPVLYTVIHDKCECKKGTNRSGFVFQLSAEFCIYSRITWPPPPTPLARSKNKQTGKQTTQSPEKAPHPDTKFKSPIKSYTLATWIILFKCKSAHKTYVSVKTPHQKTHI